MAPQRADVGIFLPGKEVTVSELSGKLEIIRQIRIIRPTFNQIFHVEEEKLDEEIYDIDGGNRPGML